MTRLLITIFVFVALFNVSCGQKPNESIPKSVDTLSKKTTRYDKGEQASVASQFAIKPLGWTSDYESVFSYDQISELDSIINKFEKETTNEIAIITIRSTWATTATFDSLTLAIAKNWGVGKKGKNNGILIGISTGLQRIRIQNGYGIEAKLTDAETQKIIDDIMVPQFKKGDYFQGTKKTLLALMQKIR